MSTLVKQHFSPDKCAAIYRYPPGCHSKLHTTVVASEWHAQLATSRSYLQLTLTERAQQVQQALVEDAKQLPQRVPRSQALLTGSLHPM